MKKFILIILSIILALTILIFFGCKKVEEITKITESEYFEMPEKIIIYDKGEQTSVEKDTELYNEIVYLMDKRLKKVKVFQTNFISDEDITIRKSSKAIEFIYSNEMGTTYGKREQIKTTYNWILFPLVGELDHIMIFGVDDRFYGPPSIWGLPKPDDLINLIER